MKLLILRNKQVLALDENLWKLQGKYNVKKVEFSIIKIPKPREALQHENYGGEQFFC